MEFLLLALLLSGLYGDVSGKRTWKDKLKDILIGLLFWGILIGVLSMAGLGCYTVVRYVWS